MTTEPLAAREALEAEKAARARAAGLTDEA